MPKPLSQVISEQRQAQDAREAEAVDRMVRTYQMLERDVRNRIVEADAIVADALRRGEPIAPVWLNRQARYRVLLQDIQQLTSLYATEGNRAIRDMRMAEILTARADAMERMDARGPGFGGNVYGTNYQATERLLSALHRDSPVHEILQGFGDEYAKVIESNLISGIANGHGADKIVRGIMVASGGVADKKRLLTIVRTEAMRAYNASLVDQYEQVPEVVEYEWTTHRSTRTCLACLALDGTRFTDPEEIPNRHPRCRCTISPVPAEEYDSVRRYFARRGTAEEWLRRQDPAKVRKMMPSADAYDAFMRGDVQLKDFAGRSHHPLWGTSVVQKSGKQVLGGISGGGGATVAKPVVAFKPASTIREAEDFARSIGVTNADYGAKSQLHVANMVNEGLADMKNRGATMPTTVGAGRFTSKSQRRVVAQYSASDDSLLWNPKNPMWNDIDAVVQKQYDSGFFSTDNPLHMIRHEMAHALDAKKNPQWYDANPLNFQRRESAWFEDPMYESSPSYVNQFIKRHVSGYGFSRNDEFIAEVFAGRMDGIDYPEEILRWYQDMSGPEIDFPEPTKETPWGKR